MEVARYPDLPRMLLARYVAWMFSWRICLYFVYKTDGGKDPSCGDAVYDISISKEAKKKGASAFAVF